MGSVGRAVSEGVDKVIQFFRDLPGDILRALGNFGRLLYQAGVDLLNGLWDGIKSMVSNLINRMKNFARDLINGFYEVLGIRSPSRVFREAGVNIVKGLVQGIERSSSSATDAVNQLAQQTMAAMDPLTGTALNFSTAVAGGDGASSGVGGVGTFILQQTNVMQPGVDVNQFSAEVWRRGAADLASSNSSLNVAQQAVQSGLAAPGSVVNLGA
jgi:phage-related protein